MNMPALSSPLFKRYERKIGPKIEEVAKASCKRSLDYEKSLTESAG